MKDFMVPLSDKRLLSVPEFQAYASIGRNNAFKLIRKSGCEIRIGNKVYADRKRFDEWCDSQTE